MSFKLPHIDLESKFTHHLTLDILERYYPRAMWLNLLSQCLAWEKRERKLSQLLIVYYVIGLWLFRGLNQQAVFARLCSGLCWLWPDANLSLPGASALLYRRQHLAVTVMRRLLRRCCRPFETLPLPKPFALACG